MFPALQVMQSHCLSCGSFDPSKLFSAKWGEYVKGVGCGFRKFTLRPNVVNEQLSPRRISYKYHLLKALATSDVSILHAVENVAAYRFWTEIGGQLKVLVKKINKRYLLSIEVVSLELLEADGQLIVSWGLFRSDSTRFDISENRTTETPFVKDSAGRLALELDLDASLAPFYISFLLKSQQGYNLKTSNVRSHRKTNFVVPVGLGSGRPSPLGISLLDNESINFAFFSRTAESVVLCLYGDTTTEEAILEIDLDPYINRTGDIWHALIDGSVPLVSYGYRCSSIENKGNHVLLDPYAKVIEDFRLGLPKKCLGKLCNVPAYDWGSDCPPCIPLEKLIVYRLNVTQFTKDKSSKLAGDIAGSFSGVSEKLHHFKDLGVNAILLEPIFSFDEQKGPYFPWHFFSPGTLSQSSGDTKYVAKSIKEMVKKLHANGIEVLLEVVFTHTSEVAALKEIDNSSYYCAEPSKDLEAENALNCNYPVVQQMILDSLRHWVIEFHIDGFCFINASSLMRGSKSELLSRPPLVEAIAFDPLLSKVKIIADTWDPRELETKEVIFPHWKRWAEMNTKFSMDVRNFLRGQAPISDLATRLCGSGDLFLGGRGPAFSFNFITRNVGFTLVDLVSFSSIETASQLSWNCGEEGATSNAMVLETRLKQIRNFIFILFISLGVPVLNMGDECGQSCGGSLAYTNQKHLDWNLLRSSFSIQVTQFISFLSSLRVRRSDVLQKGSFLEEESIEWRGPEQSLPSWDDPSCKFLAMTLKADVGGDLFVAFNSSDCSEIVSLPPCAVGENWVCLVDTALPFPGFFTPDGVPLEVGELTYEMNSHSCILFEARACS